MYPKEYSSSPRRIEDQKRASGNESGTPETRAPGGRARGTVAPALVFTLPPASGVQAFYVEHIFAGYPTNVEVEHVAGKLLIAY